ncbi:MAG: amino acid ABC transporter permease [Parvibaculaceae bacterium]
MSGFDWGVVVYAIPHLLSGTLITIQISVLALFAGTLLGVVCGMLSVSEKPWLTVPVFFYVYFVRGTPVLVQIFLIYFSLPVIGIYLSPFWGGVVALTFNAGGYISEIVRAGIQSIDIGQTEAAKAIGMTKQKTLVHILLPQSWRRILPPLTNEMITLIKTSSLLSIISIFELTRSAQVVIADKFTPFEIYSLLAVFYLIIISALSQLSTYVERRLI